MTGVLLRLASWIVPRPTRPDWLAEWRAELHHVTRIDPPRAFTFALGAFRDALWLRRHDESPRPALLASPFHTLGLLALLATFGVLCRPAPLPEDVVKIRPHGRDTVTYDQYRALAGRLPEGILAVAFYPRAPGARDGHLLARVATIQRAPFRHIAIGSELVDSVPLAPHPTALGLIVLFGVAAVLTLPALTPISGSRARLFFAAKLALALTAAFCTQGIGLLIGIVLAIRWAFADQRRRCPVCLRKLATPVSFGCLGHTLLDWHGAEYICPQGHGLLQVSATPASPYAPRQWVRL